MPRANPVSTPRGRYPAPISMILDAQDAGYRSYEDPDANNPYSSDTPQQEFLRGQWAAGRANARVDAMDAAGMFDSPDGDTEVDEP